MEKNTVLLDLSEYNRFRDLEKDIKESKTKTIIYTYEPNCWVYSKREVFSTDKAVIVVSLENDMLKTRIEELLTSYNTISNELNTSITNNNRKIQDIKEMSIWKFLKWRKK